jgi:hypothetical protein
MQQLELISCVTLLTQSKTFSIDGTLYRYSHKSDSIKSPQYFFEPLPQQKKTATLKLSKDKVLRRCYEIPGLRNQHHAQIVAAGIQQSLF